MQVFHLPEIKKRFNLEKALKLQAESFVAFSNNLAQVPMPVEMVLKNPPSSYHIKCGYLQQDKYWIIKIAGGPEDVPINGAMLAINVKSGAVDYILNDEGYLTSMRTALAGLICAKVLAPKKVKAIGVLGTGTQAYLQVKLLKHYTSCKKVIVWGRTLAKMQRLKTSLELEGFNVCLATSPKELAAKSNLIITTTASKTPLLKASHINPGTHITAVGADAVGKIELDPQIIAQANIVAVDSIKQCLHHGEVATAFQTGLIAAENLVEIGMLLQKPFLAKTQENDITIADLTGIATQDIAIAKSIILPDDSPFKNLS